MEQKTPSSCCLGVLDEEIFDCKAEVVSLPSGKLSAEPDRNNGENTKCCSHGRLNANGNLKSIPSNHTWNRGGHPDCGNSNSSIANASPENPNPKYSQKFPAHSSINRSKMANPNDTQRILPAPFLSKTYQLVDDPASDEVVSWNKNGSTFVVWQPAEFAKEILPNYFKHNNFSSFVRQLNTYGFRKIVPDRWEFAHDCFRKGEKCLLIDIHRRKAVVLSSKPSTPPHKQFMSPTNSASEQAASSSSSPLSLPPHHHMDEALRLKQENMLLVSELSRLRRLCSDLLLYVRRHIDGPSEFTSQIATLLQSKSLLEDPAACKSFWERSSPDCDNLDDTKEEGAGCEFFSSRSGDDGGENLKLQLVLPQARCKESCSYKRTATIKRIRDQDRSPPRLFGVELPCQKRISLGSSRHSDYQEKL